MLFSSGRGITQTDAPEERTVECADNSAFEPVYRRLGTEENDAQQRTGNLVHSASKSTPASGVMILERTEEKIWAMKTISMRRRGKNKTNLSMQTTTKAVSVVHRTGSRVYQLPTKTVKRLMFTRLRDKDLLKKYHGP
jgi:hypothetical protein